MSQKGKYGYWIHSGFYSSLQKLSVLLFGLVSTIILTRWGLTKYEMGIWSLFLTITGIVEVVRHGLIKNAVIKYASSATDADRRFVFTASLFLNLIITAIVAIILFLLAAPLENVLRAEGLKNVIYIFGAGLIFLVPFSHYEWIQNSQGAFKGIFYGYAIRHIFTLALMLGTLMMNGKIALEWLSAIYSAGIGIGSLVSYGFVRKYLVGRLTLSREWLSKLWHFGKYVFGSNLSSVLFRSTDQFFVSNLLSPSFVALQGIAARVTNLTDIPSQVLGDILFPKSAQANAAGDQQRTKMLYEKSVGSVLAFVMPVTIFILCFPKLIILLIAGRQYLDAAPYLQIIALSGLFMPFLKQFGTILDSTGRPKINFVVIACMAIINVLLCLWLIPDYLLIGAGLALIGTHAAGFIITQIILRKYYNINFLNCYRYAFAFYPEIFTIMNERFALKWQK